MRIEIFFPPEGILCLFAPAYDVPYRLVHTVEAPTISIEEALAWMWRYANVVEPNDPWICVGLRSAMVGDVFLVNGEAHAVMMIGFQQFEFEREAGTLTLRGGLTTRLPCRKGD